MIPIFPFWTFLDYASTPPMAPDRISNLPCHVLDDIFKHLPLHEVVRTSILSREWRYKWATISHLIFDSEFQELFHYWTPEFIIYHMLLSHKGSLVKFSLSKVGVESSLPVDHWLNLLSNHRIEDLTLHLPCISPRYEIPRVLFGFDHLKQLSLKDVDIRLPPTFRGFSGLVQLYLNNVHIAPVALQRFMSKCRKLEFLAIIKCDPSILQILVPQTHYETPSNFFHHLIHLSLECVHTDLPHTFQGFSGLVKLDIANARFSSAQLQGLLSKCPMLEFLSIIWRNDFTFYDLVIDAPKLKVLDLVGLFKSVLLNTTSLEEFSVEYGDCEHFRYDCVSGECDILDHVEFPKSNESGSNLIKIFGHLSSLRKLEGRLFCLQFMAVGGVPHELPDKLNHLTHLSLQHINFGILDNVICTLCLIRSSPNLESLDISFETSGSCVWPSYMTPLKKYQQRRKAVASLKDAARKKRGIPLTHLKAVTIKAVCGCKPEMEFVRFLLVKMNGTGVSKFEVDFNRPNGEVAMEARDALMGFHQALPKRIPLTLR